VIGKERKGEKLEVFNGCPKLIAPVECQSIKDLASQVFLFNSHLFACEEPKQECQSVLHCSSAALRPASVSGE